MSTTEETSRTLGSTKKILEREDMHDFQEYMANFIVANPMCAAWCDMGMGKTVMALTAVRELIDQFQVGYTLFVAPKLVARETWPDEVSNWAHTRKLPYTTREELLSVKQHTDPYFNQAKRDARSAHNRLKLDPLDANAMRQYKVNMKYVRLDMRKRLMPIIKRLSFINVDNFVWLVETFGPSWPWDFVVLDEAQMFRNQSSKRFKAYSMIMPYVARTLQLTGTPAPNGYLGLWSQLYMIDQGERLGRTFKMYRDKHFQPAEGGFNYWLKGSKQAKIIQSKIADVVVSMRAKDYMELGPEPIHNFIRLELTPKLMKDYKKLERDFFIEIKNEGITALTSGVVSNKLRQFCNGTIYTDEGKVVHVHKIKYEAMKELSENNLGNPMIVGYEYVHDKNRLLRLLGKSARTTKTYTREEWDAGKIEFLVMHPACLHPDTEVLTKARGWVRMVDVGVHEEVYDGDEFVFHEGCISSGVKPVVQKWGLVMTYGHRMLTDTGWEFAESLTQYGEQRHLARYEYTGPNEYLAEMAPPWNGETYTRDDEEVAHHEVFDLAFCGPRNRFLVRNPVGEVFISHNSGGHGLNLQHGGHRLTWFGCPWDLELFQQLAQRIGQVRQAQSGYERPPIYNYLVIKDTIEERIISALAAKATTQEDLVASVTFNNE